MLKVSEPLAESVSRNAFHHAQLLIGVADALRSLSVGRTKFYELVAAGEIELVKIGSKSCAVVASIEAYVDRLRAQAKRNAAYEPFDKGATAADGGLHE